MNIDSIEQDFHGKVSTMVRLVTEGLDRFRVFTPFIFEDGDHLAIVLKQEESGWVLSDEAHTYMHLSYDIEERDLFSGTRQKVIANVLSRFDIMDREGELVLNVPDERYGDALYSFVQGLLKISDVSYLSRETARSTFLEDFRSALSAAVSIDRLTFEWHDPLRDPRGDYTVDCRVNGMPRPLFVHALSSDTKTRDATIALHQFEKWGIEFRAMGIFEDQESISRPVLARYSDICENQYSSLVPNSERIANYIEGLTSN